MAVRTQRRLVAVCVTGLAIAAAAGSLAACSGHPDPEPQFSVDDALPSELVPGQQYRASVTVTFPADWPGPDTTGRSAMVALTIDLGTGDGALPCDTAGLLPEDLPTATLTCEFTPTAPTLGVQVGAYASTADAYTLDGEVHGAAGEHVYLHTVATRG